jgi:Ca2+-transporting ATPase
LLRFGFGCAVLCCAAVCVQISEGSGRILVVATGTQSEWGKTMQLVGNAGSEDTPLQEKLADLAAAIGKIGFGVAVACFIALLIKW